VIVHYDLLILARSTQPELSEVESRHNPFFAKILRYANAIEMQTGYRTRLNANRITIGRFKGTHTRAASRDVKRTGGITKLASSSSSSSSTSMSMNFAGGWAEILGFTAFGSTFG
jgi:hypothetical protein